MQTWYFRLWKTKKVIKKNWKNKEYHVQHIKYVYNQDMTIYCATKHFPELKFLGSHNKPNGVRGLG